MADRSFRWSEGGVRPTERMGDYGESITAGGTMARLRRGLGRRSRGREREEEDTSGKLGMIEGVYFRVLTNLFGVILFLRMGWMVAYAGIIVSVLIICLCSSLTLTTALSLSAICTNGKVAAGGAYYLISRALGPEFGASIGILFYIATTVSVSLYLLGFAETVINLVSHPVFSESWDMPLIGLFGLIFCQLVCLVGVSWVVKIEKFMLFVLIFSISVFAVGVFMGPKDTGPWFGQIEMSGGMNLAPDFSARSEPEFPGNDPFAFMYSRNVVSDDGFTNFNQCKESSRQVLANEYFQVNVGTTLAVFFPAVTGILAGANISGDLKNPSSSIPVGTVMAILTGALIYIFLAVLFGVSFYRTTIVSASLADNSTSGLVFSCQYGGLFHDSALVAKASAYAPFVYVGIFAASISSGLAGLLGAPRILQALARDRLFSVLDPLASGYGRSDEPLAAYAVTFVLAALFILAGDINTVAPLITTFFLSSYAMVNYACYSAEESKSPGWRPTFRYFDKWLAFLGAMGCVSVMLFLSAIFGFITFTIGLALYKYVEVYTREGAYVSNWGPHKEAAEYHTALKAALLLEQQSAPVAKPHSSMRSGPGTQLRQRKRGSSSNNSARDQDNQTALERHVEIELGAAPVRPVQTEEIDDQATNDDDEDEEDRSEFERGTFSGHEPLFDSTHVKNYRPQCLVLSGPPRRRPALAVLVAGLKKARGVTVFGDVLVGELSDPEVLRARNLRSSVSYVAKYGIKAFSDVVIAPSFRTGCRSLMQLSGLGRRMRVNTVILGFLDDWRTPLAQRAAKDGIYVEPSSSPNRTSELHEEALRATENFSPTLSVEDYVGVIGDAFDLGLGVVVLRGELDLLRSEYLTQTIRTEMDRVLNLGMGSAKEHYMQQKGSYSNPNYAADDLAPRRIQTMMSHETSDFDNAPKSTTADSDDHGEEANEERKSERRIDVWWLVDDGGLTIMIPHILRQAKTPPWIGCSMRVMAIGATEQEAKREEQDMKVLLEKLRIKAKVSVVSMENYVQNQSHPGRPSEASDETGENGGDDLENITLDDNAGARLQNQFFNAYSVMDESQNTSRRETYTKVGDMIAAFSQDALLVVVSLPVPPMSMDPEEYMHWLDLLSQKSTPPVLMVRGSQRDVLTMFS